MPEINKLNYHVLTRRRIQTKPGETMNGKEYLTEVNTMHSTR